MRGGPSLPPDPVSADALLAQIEAMLDAAGIDTASPYLTRSRTCMPRAAWPGIEQ